ncbi:MAG: hypothetical protein J0L80_16700 [Chitinophagales bacterium]|nr:hypothetical protein [Chitinophagales bacterium]
MLAIAILGIIAIMSLKFWDHSIRPLPNRYNLPLWLIILNHLALAPIVLYPFAAYASIFLFDNSDALETWLTFTLIVSYPLLLLGTMHTSYRLYTTTKAVAIMLPVAEIIIFTTLFIKYIILPV